MNIIHVVIDEPNLTAEEWEEMHNSLQDEFGDIEGTKAVLTTKQVSMAEVPELDDYIDELAEAVVEKMEKRELGR